MFSTCHWHIIINLTFTGKSISSINPLLQAHIAKGAIIVLRHIALLAQKPTTHSLTSGKGVFEHQLQLLIGYIDTKILPAQVNPSPVNPLIQVHRKEP